MYVCMYICMYVCMYVGPSFEEHLHLRVAIRCFGDVCGDVVGLLNDPLERFEVERDNSLLQNLYAHVACFCGDVERGHPLNFYCK